MGLITQSINTCYFKLIFKVSLSLGISVEIILVIESCLLQDTRGGVTQRGRKKAVHRLQHDKENESHRYHSLVSFHGL